ncbi:MAG: winged-helix domain-containing protein [Planctomycetota bacterium]
MRYRKIPDETVRRLPVYLGELPRFSEKVRQYISSQNLADCLLNRGVICNDLDTCA